MIITKTIGGISYQNNNKTVRVWMCDTIDRHVSVFKEGYEDKTRKVFKNKLDAIEYIHFLVNGE